MHLFVATDLSPGEPNLEPDEQIENLIVTREEATGDDRRWANSRREDDCWLVEIKRFVVSNKVQGSDQQVSRRR